MNNTPETPEQTAARLGMTFPTPTVKSHGLVGEGATVEHTRVGWADRAKFHEARRHFVAGGEVLVSEYGEQQSIPVWTTSTTHTSKTTTWEYLAEQVRMWRNRYPRQRFYIVHRDLKEVT